MLSEGKEEFLKKLQELGVVDITRSVKPVDEQSVSMLGRAASAKEALKILDKCDYSKDPDFDKIKAIAATKKLSSKAEEIISYVNTQYEHIKELSEKMSMTHREVSERKPWGEFEIADLERLKTVGYELNWYNVDKKSFDPIWSETYPLQVIEDNGKKVWFVVITPQGETCDLPVKPCKAPAASYKRAEADIEALHQEIIDAKASLLKANESVRGCIDSYRKASLVDLDRYLAEASSDSAAENLVSVMTGFAPKQLEEDLCKEFDQMDLYYIKEDAIEEDNPPIKLKNNWFTRQFEVLTGMYGMPVYSEFDPTPILAPFYLLFFAMCMGDAGYGLVLILFGLAVKKGWLKISMFEGLGNIISTLGVGTLIVGLVMGTAFGMDLTAQAWIPQTIRDLMLTGTIGLSPDGGIVRNPVEGGFALQMVLAIGIGILHICLAMVVKAICYTKRFGFKENISTWGWLTLILGGLIIAILAFTSVLPAQVTKWAVIVLGIVSGLGIFIFNKPGRNPLMNIGSGLWDTYNMATGILGDVLSYVRLYALGLAGGMLGGVFNDLGMQILGDGFLTWIPCILIIVAGHILNIAMSSLGAFVHPLRLTFVEYFKNSGYEGKGKRYNPMNLDTEKE